MMLSLIVALDCSLMTWVKAVRLLISMWAEFERSDKNIGC